MDVGCFGKGGMKGKKKCNNKGGIYSSKSQHQSPLPFPPPAPHLSQTPLSPFSSSQTAEHGRKTPYPNVTVRPQARQTPSAGTAEGKATAAQIAGGMKNDTPTPSLKI